METVICNESGCEAEIDPEKMQYGRDFYVLINLTAADEEDLSLQNIIDNHLVGIYCKNCGLCKSDHAGLWKRSSRGHLIHWLFCGSGSP